MEIPSLTNISSSAATLLISGAGAWESLSTLPYAQTNAKNPFGGRTMDRVIEGKPLDSIEWSNTEK